jgi:hypothetical protein
MTNRVLIRGALLLAVVMVVSGCQFEKRCGEDPYMYKAGLCYPIVDAGSGDKDSSTEEEGDEDAGPDDEGGTGDAAQYCKATCDLIGACLAESPVGGLLVDQLAMIGFEGTDRSGCVSYCEDHSSGAGDAEALECFSDAESKAMCTPDEFSSASVDATNECCKGHADSEYCVELCNALKSQPLAYDMVSTTCNEVLE